MKRNIRATSVAEDQDGRNYGPALPFSNNNCSEWVALGHQRTLSPAFPIPLRLSCNRGLIQRCQC
jgi:hypothetical protein